MTGRLGSLLAVAAAGVMAAAAGYDGRGQQATAAGPYYVRVVDAQDRAVPKVAVEVRVPDRPVRSFTTDGDGRAVIPEAAASTVPSCPRRAARRPWPGPGWRMRRADNWAVCRGTRS